MLNHSLSVLLDAMPALAVLETSSRFLLTLGVGLFIAYVICMLGANLFGMTRRYLTTLKTSRIAEQPSSVVVKREVS